jgi:hypothetical protein
MEMKEERYFNFLSYEKYIYANMPLQMDDSCWHTPNSLRDSMWIPNWKKRKNKELGHAPWLVAL